MGKLVISDELKKKLSNVYNNKMTKITPKETIPIPPPQPNFDKKEVIEEDDDYMTAFSSIIKRKKKKPKKEYDKIIYIFGGSVIVGFGLTLGFKLGKLIFY